MALSKLLGPVLAIVLAGCASVPERHPLPEAPTHLPQIPNIPNARYGGYALPSAIAWPILNESPEQARARLPGIANHPHMYLAISGGGADGAFGAGLLNGWTASGTRPEFDMVTGISTGALAAPFAFLGPAYDAALRQAFTAYSTEDLIRKRGMLAFLTGDSAVDVSGLKSVLAKFINEDMVRAIALEYAKGRRLYIGTTNLDSGHAVLWDITAIAASGQPSALELIRKIMLASASIPVVFPPVYFKIEYEGHIYDEMHVDGGTTQQVFVYPSGILWKKILDKLGVPEGTSKAYIIRNAFVLPKWDPIRSPTILPIAARSISSLIRVQGNGDLTRIYSTCLRDDIEFNLAEVPSSFDKNAEGAFDRKYMQALYDVGYELAKNGYPWAKSPPYYTAAEEGGTAEAK